MPSPPFATSNISPPSKKILIVLSLGLALCFQWDLLDGSLRLGIDLLTVHYPFQKAVSEGAGMFSPQLGYGLDLFAEGHAGVLNPFNMPIRLLGLDPGFTVATILVHSIAFLGMGLLLAGRGMTLLPLLFGMIVYGGSLTLLLRIEHWNYFQVICCIPMILYGQERRDLGGFLVAALLLGCGLLASAAQYVFIALILWVLNGWLQNCFSWRSFLLLVTLAIGLAFPQLQATAQQVLISERVGGAAYWQHSLPWHHLLGLFFPFPFGNIVTNSYLGGGPPWEFALFSGFSALFLFLWKGPTKYKVVFFISLLFSLGEHVPGLKAILGLFPFSLFRGPGRYAIIAIFFLACGSAHVLGAMRHHKPTFSKGPQFFAILTAIFISFILVPPLWEKIHLFFMGLIETPIENIAQHSDRSATYFTKTFSIVFYFALIQAAVASLVLVLVMIFIKQQRLSALVLLLLIETLIAGHWGRSTFDRTSLEQIILPPDMSGLIWISPEDRRRLEVEAGEAGLPYQDRIMAAKPFVASMLLDRPHRDPLAHSPLRPLSEKILQSYLRAHPDNIELMRRAGIAWEYYQGQWQDLQTPQGALFYPGSPQATAISLEERLLSTSVEKTLHWPDQTLESESIEISLNKDSELSYRLVQNHTSASGWIRLPLMDHPNWKVHVNGQPVESQATDLIFLAFPVPASPWEATVMFDRTWPLTPMLLCASLWVCVLILLGWKRNLKVSSF